VARALAAHASKFGKKVSFFMRKVREEGVLHTCLIFSPRVVIVIDWKSVKCERLLCGAAYHDDCCGAYLSFDVGR
jgi:hypothetical protein